MTEQTANEQRSITPARRDSLATTAARSGSCMPPRATAPRATAQTKIMGDPCGSWSSLHDTRIRERAVVAEIVVLAEVDLDGEGLGLVQFDAHRLRRQAQR